MKHFFQFATFFLFLPLFAAPIALRDGWDDVKTQTLPSQFQWRSDTAGARILQVCNKETGKGGLVSFPLDLNRYAGKLVEVTALIKAVKVTKPGVGYLGIKFMLPYRSFGIAKYQSATDGLHGTFDYKKFALTVQLPKEVEMANVAFGLQDSTGEVFFRDFKIRIISPEEFQKLPFQLPEDFQCEYSPAVRNRPIARGVMTPDPRVLTAKDIRDLKLWNVTLVRWQFLSNRPGFPDEYQKTLGFLAG